jgi:hypothetical protein
MSSEDEARREAAAAEFRAELVAQVGELPVIRELTARYGPPPFEHLSGQPGMFREVIRMPWVWFIDGRNFNLAIDTDLAGAHWTVRAIGPAGHAQLQAATGQRPGDGQIRGVLTAAGLLGWPADEPAKTAGCGEGKHGGTWFDRELCAEPCGKMHTRCNVCDQPVDGCPFEGTTG